jgi:O-antigen ligase
MHARHLADASAAADASATTTDEDLRTPLPTWPLTALFGCYPLWWALGVVDIIWIPAAAVMLAYLGHRGAVRLPLGAGIWALFLVWALFSVVELTRLSSLFAFGYRYVLYLSCTVILVYVYNGRRRIRERFVAGLMTVFWLWTVVFGYLGLVLPNVKFDTLVSRIVAVPAIAEYVPSVILQNQLVQQMIVRPFAQYNADGYTNAAPRPSAPFLYTNNWGNAYSLLIPFVVIYLLHVRRERRFGWLLLALVLSLVPAFLTLNRGMFIGLAVAVAYVAFRLALQGNLRGVAVAIVAVLLGVAAFAFLPVQDRLDQRLETNSSTETRANLYQEAITATSQSPLLGFGGPQPSSNPNAPSVGTQGQFWLVLYSHGIGGIVLFMGWFVVTFAMTLRRRDTAGIAWNAVLLVTIVELLYYGVLPSGLPIIMVAAALALRGADDPVSAGGDVAEPSRA